MPRTSDYSRYPSDCLVFMLTAGDSDESNAPSIHYADKKDAHAQAHYLNGFRKAHSKRLVNMRNALSKLRISPLVSASGEDIKKLTIMQKLAEERLLDKPISPQQIRDDEIAKLAHQIKQFEDEEAIMQPVVIRVVADAQGPGATLIAINSRDRSIQLFEDAVRRSMTQHPDAFQSPTSLRIKELLGINNHDKAQ